MLYGKLLHPEILRTLGACGHFSQVLIADGNYPVATMSSPLTPKVHLNLMADVPTVSQVLEALASCIPVQAAAVVRPPEDGFGLVFDDYRKLLPPDLVITEMERMDFYARVKSSDTGLIIATADTRRFANLLLTIGVVKTG